MNRKQIHGQCRSRLKVNGTIERIHLLVINVWELCHLFTRCTLYWEKLYPQYCYQHLGNGLHAVVTATGISETLLHVLPKKIHTNHRAIFWIHWEGKGYGIYNVSIRFYSSCSKMFAEEMRSLPLCVRWEAFKVPSPWFIHEFHQMKIWWSYLKINAATKLTYQETTDINKLFVTKSINKKESFDIQQATVLAWLFDQVPVLNLPARAGISA